MNEDDVLNQELYDHDNNMESKEEWEWDNSDTHYEEERDSE